MREHLQVGFLVVKSWPRATVEHSLRPHTWFYVVFLVRPQCSLLSNSAVSDRDGGLAFEQEVPKKPDEAWCDFYF